MANRVLVTFPSVIHNPGRHTELAQEAGLQIVDAKNTRPLTAEEMIPLVSDVEAIISGVDVIDARVVAAAPRLKVVSRHGVGYDSVDVAAATKAGVVVTTTPGTNHVSVAELSLGFILALARRIPQMNDATHAGQWPRFRGSEVAGKTIGIVGLGRVGKALATRARGLEMQTLAYDVVQDDAFARQHGITYVPFEELLCRSDFVSLHCPATPGAPFLIGETELRLMKPTAFLVNSARGTLVDEGAVYRALSEGRLAGLGTDVFRQEPPGPNPLLTLDSVIATPHIGGTLESGARSALMAVENILQVLRGERCPNAINPEVYEQGVR